MIAFDAKTEVSNGTTPSLTFAHTCTGNDRVLIVGIVGDLTDDVTGVTYAGTSMALVDKILVTGAYYLYMYILAGPASGSNNVVVSKSSGTMGADAVSYTGCSPAQPDTSNKTLQTASGDQALSLSTNADNCWLVVEYAATVAAAVSNVNSTQRTAIATGPSIADSNAAMTPAGTFGIGWHWNSVDTHGIIGVGLAPFVPTGGGTITLMGV